MELTLAKRFDIQNIGGMLYAALSLGSPSVVIEPVDIQVFRKNDFEKGRLATLKSQTTKARGHKFKTLFIGSF